MSEIERGFQVFQGAAHQASSRLITVVEQSNTVDLVKLPGLFRYIRAGELQTWRRLERASRTRKPVVKELRTFVQVLGGSQVHQLRNDSPVERLVKLVDHDSVEASQLLDYAHKHFEKGI